MSLLRVTAHLASPVVADDEIHLDSILIAARPGRGPRPTRTTPVGEIAYPQIPVPRVSALGSWVYACTTWTIPPEARGGLEHLTKRKDKTDVHMAARAFTPGSGKGRDYHLPIPTVETPWVSWDVIGRRAGLLRLLRYVTSIGSKRRHGYGEVVKWEVDPIDGSPDTVLADGNKARRWLPARWAAHAATVERGPTVPPYWHAGLSIERVRPGVAVALDQGVLDVVRRLS